MLNYVTFKLTELIAFFIDISYPLITNHKVRKTKLNTIKTSSKINSDEFVRPKATKTLDEKINLHLKIEF